MPLTLIEVLGSDSLVKYLRDPLVQAFICSFGRHHCLSMKFWG